MKKRAAVRKIWLVFTCVSKGYRIATRRFKVREGEVDIIARRGNVIAMVEVKQRATEKRGSAERIF